MNHATDVTASDSTRIQRRRRRSRPSAAADRRAIGPGRIRAFYFTLAALWGFTMGAAALVVMAAVAGQSVRLTPVLATIGAGGAAVAVLGGLIAAAAYKQARRRR